MTLEQAMAQSEVNSAISSPISGSSFIVDGVATRRFGHYDEDHYWVQRPNQITRNHYSSMEEVRRAIGVSVDWQPMTAEEE